MDEIEKKALSVLADEPCIGNRESPERFAHRIAVAAIRSAQVREWRPEDTLLLQAISAQLRRAGNVVQAKHVDRAVAALSPNGGEG